MSNVTVRLTFTKAEGGAVAYILPLVFSVSDPKEGMKATVIKGTRADGSIVIPGGKESQEIRVKGNLAGEDYNEITTKMNEMRTKVTTDLAYLKLEHYDSGWVTDWEYTVRRIEEIVFPQSLRTSAQEYQITFLVLSY